MRHDSPVEGRREERGADPLRPSSKAEGAFNFRREEDEAVPLIKLELTPPRVLLDAAFAPPPPAFLSAAATLGAGFSKSPPAPSLSAALAPSDAAGIGIANPAVARAIASATSSAALASATTPPPSVPSAVPAAVAAAAVNTVPAPSTPFRTSSAAPPPSPMDANGASEGTLSLAASPPLPPAAPTTAVAFEDDTDRAGGVESPPIEGGLLFGVLCLWRLYLWCKGSG